MNKFEFLDEVKNSKLCPDSFETIYSQFNLFQKAALDTLIEVHRVCEMNGITYELAYGSLLGLIRDGGQIPWDYDIDIIVPFEEKRKLVDALEKDLKSSFYYYCPDNNPKCRHMIMRVAPNDYRSEALHVDVFFYVGTPDNEAERKKYAREIATLSELRFGKLVNLREESLGNPVKFVKLLLRRKIPSAFISLSKINKEYNTLCNMYSSSKASYCISADSFAEWRFIPTYLLWETKIVNCDYGEIRIPTHYDEILSIMYGDYHSIPPLEERIHEVMSNYERIIKYGKTKGR